MALNKLKQKAEERIEFEKDNADLIKMVKPEGESYTDAEEIAFLEKELANLKKKLPSVDKEYKSILENGIKKSKGTN